MKSRDGPTSAYRVRYFPMQGMNYTSNLTNNEPTAPVGLNLPKLCLRISYRELVCTQQICAQLFYMKFQR